MDPPVDSLAAAERVLGAHEVMVAAAASLASVLGPLPSEGHEHFPSELAQDHCHSELVQYFCSTASAGRVR